MILIILVDEKNFGYFFSAFDGVALLGETIKQIEIIGSSFVYSLNWLLNKHVEDPIMLTECQRSIMQCDRIITTLRRKYTSLKILSNKVNG